MIEDGMIRLAHVEDAETVHQIMLSALEEYRHSDFALYLKRQIV